MNDGEGYPRHPVGRAAPVSSGHPAAAPAYPSPGGVPPQFGAAPVGAPAPGTAGVPAPSTTDDAGVRAVRRPGHLGSLSTGQILVAEAAVVLAVAAATRGPVPGLIAGAVALLLVTLAFARRRQRWWLEDRVIAWRYRRRRAAAVDRTTEPVLAALRTIAPGLTVREVSAPDGARVGVARDEAGWFSVVALTPTAPVHAEGAPVPLDALVGVLAATEQPGVVLQLVNHTVPAPSLDVPSASPAGASYQQLTSALSPIAVPAHRESSVAVRIDARSLAEALLDHHADAEAAASLVASLGRRTATSLRRLGIACRVLDTQDLVAALARSCDVEPGGTGDGSPVHEEWSRWHSAQLLHRTFWLRTWPSSTAAIGALFDRVAATPAAQTSMALVLDPSGGDDVAVRALIRLAARPDDDFAALERALTEGVRRLGGDLQPLDGEQGPAAYATAPTGGGAG
ncbi:type VII secretion protein EccE [Micromonospora mangrovi]|uniref:Type VII secretion protein EccE n=2 Tax=Micromonospora TaxID=1873 RepID=A0AAU8H5E2_9ACTN